MKKTIYFGILHYKWRTISYLKGIKKPAKKWSESKHETVFTDLDVEKLNSSDRYIKRLKNLQSSSKEIEVKITKVENPIYLCMSNDIY